MDICSAAPDFRVLMLQKETGLTCLTTDGTLSPMDRGSAQSLILCDISLIMGRIVIDNVFDALADNFNSVQAARSQTNILGPP